MTYTYDEQGELFHYGRLGMKWGRHIFGRKNTESGGSGGDGRGRDDDRRSGSSRSSGRSGGGSGVKDHRVTKVGHQSSFSGRTSYSPAKKPMSEMTDAELRKAANRYNLEADYMTALKRANPNSGKKSFANQLVNDAVKPALINAGRTQMEKYLNREIGKMLGNDGKDTIGDLKKQAEEFGLRSKITTAKKVVAQNEDWLKERAAKNQAQSSSSGNKSKESKRESRRTTQDDGRITDERFLLEDKKRRR